LALPHCHIAALANWQHAYFCHMTKIGLLSDTHNYLDSRVLEHFADCDEIWHAGDFGTLALAEQLAAFKPLRGVYGNIDGHDVRYAYKETARFMCEEVEVFMTHIGGYPGKYTPIVKQAYREKPFQLFISGHSHILKVMYDDAWKYLHINPGAAGKQGWQKVSTLVKFTIHEKEIRDLVVVELAK
jgi:putative phosphoesterase